MDSGANSCGEEAGSEPLVTEHMRSGLEVLWKAAKYAHNASVDMWNLAVEIDEIRGAGLASSDLRWLIAKGYVEHATEIDAESTDQRSFETLHRFRFTDASCFVLTNLGIEFARLGLLEPLRATSGDGVEAADSPPLNCVNDSTAHQAVKGGDPSGQVPRWDSARRELWLGRTLVKRFRVPAPHQELVLTVFQEDDWPERIDDPLPPQPAIDPKRQLHATISSLNRHQKQALIHFTGDGTGTGVLWEIDADGPASRD